MTQEKILSIAEQSGSLKRKDGMYVFTEDELFWFVNNLANAERLEPKPPSSAEEIVKAKEILYKHWDNNYEPRILAAMQEHASYAYDRARCDEEKVILEWIKNWDGNTNSAMGELLGEKAKEVAVRFLNFTQQWGFNNIANENNLNTWDEVYDYWLTIVYNKNK